MSGAGSGALSGAASGAAIGTQIFPGWGTAIGAGVGAIAGFLGGKSADKKAEAAKRERKMYGEQNMAMNRELFEQEKRIMRPIKERLGAEAMSSQPLDYAQISARIRQNYANALRQLNETSGIGASRNQGARLKMATELAGAYGQGLANRRNLGLALMGRDQTAQYASNLGRSYENMAEMARQEQMLNEASARENYAMAAQGLGQALYGAQQMFNKPEGDIASNPWGNKVIVFPSADIPTSTPTYGGGLNAVTVTPGLTGGGYAGLPKLG